MHKLYNKFIYFVNVFYMLFAHVNHNPKGLAGLCGYQLDNRVWSRQVFDGKRGFFYPNESGDDPA